MSNETKRDVFEKALREWDDLVHSCGLQGEEAHGGCEFDPILIKYRKDYDAALPDNLPVIPKNVANYLVDCKRANTTIGTSLSGNIVLFSHARSHDMIHDILSWLCPSDNQDLFARAWLDGYVVEGKHD
ncbi:DUF1642 domain-containing protein [Lactiplantibacillus argentoratensis]|nr:DUF1642 domain-containing protein [Lactiplantibacillus argentoratensis]MBT1143251.1 DUF1642 domain-containing protein [Lactiplantibacillus argentoratensis]MBT1146111.1 DUF1642 domain-containing protein [Lactiplantibacillus argentoratensis]MBT1148866.1 DUF1642 domain-containing protein [Lactiplantibacillus argentoratensis]MBT1151902.1 DUF1642 domain-containing protein [Lactiplantibacillus argentoratensis]